MRPRLTSLGLAVLIVTGFAVAQPKIDFPVITHRAK